MPQMLMPGSGDPLTPQSCAGQVAVALRPMQGQPRPDVEVNLDQQAKAEGKRVVIQKAKAVASPAQKTGQANYGTLSVTLLKQVTDSNALRPVEPRKAVEIGQTHGDALAADLEGFPIGEKAAAITVVAERILQGIPAEEKVTALAAVVEHVVPGHVVSLAGHRGQKTWVERAATTSPASELPPMPTYDELKAQGKLYSQRYGDDRPANAPEIPASREERLAEHFSGDKGVWKTWAGAFNRSELRERDPSAIAAIEGWETDSRQVGRNISLKDVIGYAIPTKTQARKDVTAEEAEAARLKRAEAQRIIRDYERQQSTARK